MVEITKCITGSKNGKEYCIVHFFDAHNGSAGNCIMSPKYLEKLTNGVADGKTLRIGRNRENHKQFLYVK